MFGCLVFVEDDAWDQQLIARALRRLAPQVEPVFVADGVRALRTLGIDPPTLSGIEPPSILFLDVKIPFLSGLEVLARARKDRRFDRTPIVMLTSSDDPADLGCARQLGANGYVVKAVDPIEFDQAISAAVQFYLNDGAAVLNSPYCLFLERV